MFKEEEVDFSSLLEPETKAGLIAKPEFIEGSEWGQSLKSEEEWDLVALKGEEAERRLRQAASILRSLNYHQDQVQAEVNIMYEIDKLFASEAEDILKRWASENAGEDE
jgi:hypothetical protein